MNIEKSKIHIEVFSSIRLPHESPDDASIELSLNGNKKARVRLNGKSYEVEVRSNESVLEALLRNKIDAPFSCTAGACATCMAKLKSGKVEMTSCFALDEDEIEEGFILTCQSHPTTNEVELTYDLD